VTDVGGNAVATSGTTEIVGNFGTLTIAADGVYTYNVDPTNASVLALGASDELMETFTYTLSDGTEIDTADLIITINGLADAPVLNLDPNNDSGTSGDPSDDGADDGNFQVTFIENDAPVPIVDMDVSITDPEDDIVEVIVTLTNGQSGDTFNFPSILPGNVTAAVTPIATLTAPGVMTVTLTGESSTTSADWTAILQSITFNPSTDDVHNPNPADRNITIVATDAQMESSQLLETIVHVVPVNDPPTLDLDDDNSGGINAGNYQGTYVENGTDAPISSGVVVTDLDDINLEGVTISLTNGEVGDILNIGTLPTGISLVGSTPSELTAAGDITFQLTGSASISDYQDAIAAITFASTSENPTASVREITVVGTDGEDNSPTRTAFITVEPVNDAPIPVDPLDPANPFTEADAIPAQNGVDDAELIPFDVTTYFADLDDTVLMYSLGPDTPSWINIDGMTGEITGTPPADASQNTNVLGNADGVYTVTVVATDPDGLTGETTIEYTISNTIPVAVDDAFDTDENAAPLMENVFTANPTIMDSDLDGDMFTLGETRDTSVSYTIDDGEGGTDTATVTVTVTGTNDAPIPTLPVDPLDPTTPITPTDPLDYIPLQNGQDGEAVVAPLDLTEYFTDPDTSDVLTVSIDPAELPPGLTFNGTAIVGTPDANASQLTNTLGSVPGNVYNELDLRHHEPCARSARRWFDGR